METGDGGGDRPGDSGGEKRDIRRPMNAFLIFCKRHRSMVREKHPDRDNRSVTRILGDLWANLPDDEKAVYTNLAKTYKDAFMKANPDYKWHSTDRLPQPAKMATRPTNVRPPRSLSTSDSSSVLPPDGDKLGGVNMLLLAGKQNMPVTDQPLCVDKRFTSPDITGANSALLQFAEVVEMCSASQGIKRHTDSAALCSTPPKKRARHWSHSDAVHNNVTENNKLQNTICTPFLYQTIPNPTLTSATKPVPPPTATQTIQLPEPAPKQDRLCQIDDQALAVVPRQEIREQHCEMEFPNQTVVVKNMVKEEKAEVAPKVQPGPESFVPHPDPVSNLTLSQTESFTTDVGIPPKKKFTKLHDRYKGERQSPAETVTTTTTTTTASGCLSDQNDNAIFTCGKLVVDHIIDRLFSASFTSSEHNESSVGPSSTDIEKVRKIITADITEREKSQGPSSKHMGKLLSEVVHKPPNLVEKVIEEAYSMDLKRRVKQEPTLSSEPSQVTVTGEPESKPKIVPRSTVLVNAERFSKLEAIPEQTGPEQGMVPEEKQVVGKLVTTTTAQLPFHAASNGDPSDAPKYSPLLPIPVKEDREGKYTDDIISDPSKEEVGDFIQDDDDGYSQPVRKSRRRNRGQRYQELINEGIIQPSKERLAARRHEQILMPMPMSLPNSLYMGEELAEDEVPLMERPRLNLKKSIGDMDLPSGDEKRYRTGDFDLEAEIATLPPCSLDQVPRRRGPRKRSDSENGRRPPGSPPQGKEDGSPDSPPVSTTMTATAPSQPSASSEPLTGSQKRKARKHSINRLVASTDSGSSAKPPGIEASIPMVRDATVSPVKRTLSATSASESSPKSTTSSESCVSNVASAIMSGKDTTADCNKVNMQQGQEQAIVDLERTLTTEKSGSTADNSLEQRNLPAAHTHTATADVLRTTSAESSSIAKPLLEGSIAKIAADSFGEGKHGEVSSLVSTDEETQKSVDLYVVTKQKREIHTAGVKNLIGARVTVSVSKENATSCSSKQCGMPGSLENSEGSVHALEGGVLSESVVRKCGADRETVVKSQQLKGMRSSDSALGSSTDQCEDMDRESSLDAPEEEDKPRMFLSETSGLLCVTQPTQRQGWMVSTALTAETGECISRGSKSSPESVFDRNEEKPSIITTRLLTPLSEDQEDDTAIEDSTSRSPVAMDTEDSLDNGNSVIVTVSSSDCVSHAGSDLSSFSSGASATPGPRVTTVAMTTTDAMPTALSLEMMEEEGMVDSGMANSMLCGSPMPESPSVTAVHS